MDLLNEYIQIIQTKACDSSIRYSLER